MLRPSVDTDSLNLIRVLTRREALKAINVSKNTWDRMERRGETPPLTRLSPNRVGYRVTDLKKWLDARRLACT